MILFTDVHVLFFIHLGVFGVMYDGYLTNAEDDVEGAVPVIIKTVKGMRILWQSIYKYWCLCQISKLKVQFK